ncbi:MAG TPA: hypothetical protein ENF60_00340, partial [Candidatus Omnitrophica bacterium]|nr:hypothetical protein [Candidatus Omnitrophota bacterium]
MKEIKEVKYRVFKTSFMWAGFLILISLVAGNFYIAGGLLLGVGSGVFNFFLLARKIQTQQIGYFIFGNYILRYFLLAVILIFSAIINKEMFAGSAIGVLIPQFVIY